MQVFQNTIHTLMITVVSPVEVTAAAAATAVVRAKPEQGEARQDSGVRTGWCKSRHHKLNQHDTKPLYHCLLLHPAITLLLPCSSTLLSPHDVP